MTRIIPKLTQDVIDELNAKHGRVFVITGAIADDDDEDQEAQHLCFRPATDVEIKRTQRLNDEDKEEAAISSLCADVIVWPPQDVRDAFFKVCPLASRRVYRDALKIAAGEAPVQAKKAKRSSPKPALVQR